MSRGARIHGGFASPSTRAVSDQLGAQHRRCWTVLHPGAKPFRSHAQQVIADGSGKHIGWRTATASVRSHHRMSIRLHRLASIGSKRPPGTAVCNATVAARSSAESGRSPHSQQTPHTDAAGGFATAGTLNSNQPTRRFSHIKPEHTMQDRIRRGRASSQLRAALRRIGTSSGSSGPTRYVFSALPAS
jgi:hypothetical protein